MTISRAQMYRQLYQNGGNTLPIYPRIEAIETSLGSAEKRIGDPALGQFSGSPLSNVYNNETSGIGIGSIFGNTGQGTQPGTQPGTQQPSMPQPIQPGPQQPSMPQPIQPGPSIDLGSPIPPYEKVIMGPDGNLIRNPNPPAPGQVPPGPQIDPNRDYGFNQYGFDTNLLNYLNRQKQASFIDAGIGYGYDPTTQTFSGGNRVNQYGNIPLSVLQQVATSGDRNLLNQYITGGRGFNQPQQFSYGGRAGYQMGGIASLVDREKYGLGSKIKEAFKSAARTFIPKELDPVLKFAAPFLGPVYGPIASIAGSARTGKIDPFSLAAATLPYVQFGGGSGLGSLMPTGYGGSQYGIFGGDYVGLGSQGTSLSQLISDKAREFLSPNTPIQNLLKGPSTSYTGGVDALTYDPNVVGQNIYGSTPTSPTVGTVIEGPGGGTVVESLSFPSTDIVTKATQPGYVDLIKRAGSLENVPLSERFNAVKDLSTKALKDIYTTPVINPKTGETTYKLDKNSLYATFAGASSFIEAKKLANKAGVPEFSEADYQRFKIQPEKEKYTDVLKPGSFGIRPQSANGGLMDGVLSIKLTPAMAMGGRIDYETGGPTTTTPAKTLPMDLDSLARRLFNTNLDNLSPSEKQYLYEFKEQYKNKKAKGGPMGSEIPVRQNQGGITELDLRAKGGYIPVGIKEKADDVPAMLSKNEFVFTADAVRGAGNGNINKGAQKMYKLMKSLEKKVKKMKKVA